MDVKYVLTAQVVILGHLDFLHPSSWVCAAARMVLRQCYEE